MNNQQTQPCPDCDGYGFTIDVEHDIFYGDGEPTLLKCLKCQGKGYIPGEPEPPEYDADKAEREENARLDAIEDEANLKAYRAEHGDDAPDPLEEIEIEHAEMGDAEDYDQLRIERGEFETENYQLKQQLAAVTADLETARCTQEELQSLATAQNSRIEYLETQLGFISGLLNPEVTNIQVAREIMEEIREVAREVFTTTPDEQIQRIEVLKQNAAALDESILAAVTAERDALKTQMAQIAKMARLFIQKERDHKNSEYLWHEGLLAILTMTGE